ncbi:MAG: thiolase family protein [Bacillota bacterium]|nr:thiolase family protein [Bacillota bacterium]
MRIYIQEAVRLPVGKFGGSYKDVLSQDLGAKVLRECIKRSQVNKEEIDEVIVGNIMQYDPKGNPAREASLKADIPIKIPSFTINKNCGSSMRAVTLASSLIKGGEGSIYLAAGMENMTRCPYLLRNARFGYRMGDGVISDSLTDGLVGMGLTAERLAEKYNISREEQDEFAYNSQKKAIEAAETGAFKEELMPIKIETRKGSYVLDKDEGIKFDSSIEGLSKLKPVFKENGTVTAGNSSTINDGAAAVLVVSESALKNFQKEPLAEILSYASVGCDPKIMGIGPVPATRKALKIAGLNIEDIDLIELNEAFAAQSLSVIKELKLDMEKVNINGSGISIGHPVGATGAIIITKLAYQLKRLNKKYGLATMCIGGGQGIAIVLKNTQIK